ncbi:hypothetical protein LR48_Vigan50s009200 [Vigna angularis]|uniref:Uncharacterized protein n=1 Tax=Phaseolus angularis TaxID=3914 RepID=A0A0L9T3M3_PHAAN|nr:hypothetical protein LR48_Vigan50s009200 [Vigna angularis]
MPQFHVNRGSMSHSTASVQATTEKVDSNSFDSSTHTRNSDIGKGFNQTDKVVRDVPGVGMVPKLNQKLEYQGFGAEGL